MQFFTAFRGYSSIPDRFKLFEFSYFEHNFGCDSGRIVNNIVLKIERLFFMREGDIWKILTNDLLGKFD
ncbi:hypothetical protein HMSSN139_07160 [Paenibacillus sp. HMSSN-139]|nr:hypothetical protein HMSSN139_07160 [Paenibacillus sp. HMSSN-139]